MSQLSCVPCHIWSSIGATLPWTPKAQRTFKSQHHPSNDDHDDKYDDYDGNTPMTRATLALMTMTKKMTTMMTKRFDDDFDDEGIGSPTQPHPDCRPALRTDTLPSHAALLHEDHPHDDDNDDGDIDDHVNDDDGVGNNYSFATSSSLLIFVLTAVCTSRRTFVYLLKILGCSLFFFQKLLIQETFHIEANKLFLNFALQ